MTGLEFIELTRFFQPGHTVLDRISFTVAPGEFLVILGPSGSGKSTLLRLIAGLDHPNSGDIRFDGQSILALPPAARDVGMVFQNYALYPHLTVWENLAFPLLVRKVPKATIAQRVERIAKVLHIETLLQRKPRELSGGQQQRVALGRALIRQPRVFLLDEPLSNLDAQLRQQMRKELVQLQQHSFRTTTLYVTHDQTEAMTMGDRIAILHEGKLQQIGTPEEIYRRPANRFVASFIGTPPMNFFTGRLEMNPPAFRATAQFHIPLHDFQQEGQPMPSTGTLGIRPEHLQLAPTDALFTAVVEFVENTGYEYLVHCFVNQQSFCFRSTVPLQPQQRIPIALRPQAVLYWFSETGECIVTWSKK